MLFLEYFFLNCNSEIELQKNSLIKGSATCLIQKKEENIDFYISENFQIEEIFFTRGGTSLYYEKKETQNDLSGWNLASIPEGEYEITIEYSGFFGKKHDSYNEFDFKKGLLPLNKNQKGCSTFNLKGTEKIILNSEKNQNDLIYLCDLGNKLFEIDEDTKLTESSNLKIISKQSKTNHKEWIDIIESSLEEIQQKTSYQNPQKIVILEGEDWYSQKGLIIVPKNYLENKPIFSEINKHLIYQWEDVEKPILEDPKGRILNSYLNKKFTPLSRRINDRAHLQRTNGKDEIKLKTVMSEYSNRNKDECVEEKWSQLKITKTKVARLNDGYELSIYTEWNGKCKRKLDVIISNSNKKTNENLNIQSGNSIHKIMLKWIPRYLMIDPDFWFPGELERDSGIPLIFESINLTETEWIQPKNTITSIGPGGISWPNREKIKLPDGTERNWTEKSYLVLASSKEIFLISAKKTTIPKLNEDAINWGWILLEDGIPVKWGNNTKARIYKLPNPEIFSWGD